jgi:hypothetical protein
MTIKAGMHKQGNQWVVVTYDGNGNAHESNACDWWHARAIVGSANCRHADDGQCDKVSHDHR